MTAASIINTNKHTGDENVVYVNSSSCREGQSARADDNAVSIETITKVDVGPGRGALNCCRLETLHTRL